MLWNKLPDKKIKNCEPYELRVLQFDPVNVPNLFTPKPFKRQQWLCIGMLFPDIPGHCACGCGQRLTGRRTRWANEQCQKFAVAVYWIVYGRAEVIGKYLRLYYGWKCKQCQCNDKGHDYGKLVGVVAWIKIDHIIPVKQGGGACWLSNYQLLCHDCHTGKTNKDFNWKGKKLRE